MTQDEKLDEVQPAAERAAKRRNYADLDEYFAERGNQKLDIIVNELELKSKSLAGPLRLRYLGDEISTQSTLKPRVQRNIIADIRTGEFTDPEIRERNECSVAALRQVRKRLQPATEEQQEGNMN